MNFWERFIAFLLPLAAGLFVLISTYFGGDLSLLPGDLGDTRFNLFVLEHCHQYFSGTVDAFWSAGFMYPEQEVISMSDNLLGSAPIYSVFRLFGFDLFTAFQYWAITLAILNYTAAYLLVSYLSKKTWFAGIAAFVFAFSLGLAAQMNHAQTFPRFAIPLALLFLLFWKDRNHWKWFFLAVLSLTYTFYCGIYLGFMALVPFAILFVFIAIHNWQEIKSQFKYWKTTLMYALSLVINLGLLYVLFASYLRRATSNPLHKYSQIKESIPTPESYFSAHPGTFIHGSLENYIGSDQAAYWDHWLFSGWLVLLGALTMLVLTFRKRLISSTLFTDRNTWLLMITGTITLLLFLRVGDYSLYYLLYQLPGFGAMRSMTRVINVELLFFGIGLAFLLTGLANKAKNYRIFVFFITIPILLIDNSFDPAFANTTPKKVMQKRHSTLVEKMDDIPKGSIVSYEPDLEQLNTQIAHYQIDAMLAAQALGLKSVNGYSAQAAYRFDRYWIEPNPENRKYWFDRFENMKHQKIYVVK